MNMILRICQKQKTIVNTLVYFIVKYKEKPLLSLKKNQYLKISHIWRHYHFIEICILPLRSFFKIKGLKFCCVQYNQLV